MSSGILDGLNNRRSRLNVWGHAGPAQGYHFELCLLALVLAAASVPVLNTSLWLDEAETWCTVNDGLERVWSTRVAWGATSPFYYFVVWLLTKVFGLSALTLRLPSVAFSVGTAVVLYRLAMRWLDREGAILSAAFFFAVHSVWFSVIDARPYALALLLLACAWLAMLRWVETKRRRDGVFFVLSAAGVIWAQYTMAFGLVPLAWYFRRLGWRRARVALTAIALLAAPCAAQIADRLARRAEMTVFAPPSQLVFWKAMLPVPVLSALLFGPCMTVASRLPRHEDFRLVRTERSLVPLVLLAWAPPLVAFGLSGVGAVELFADRYLLCKEIGLAIVTAWLVAGLTDRRVRRVTTLAIVAVSIVWNMTPGRQHGFEKWREASIWARREISAHPNTVPVFVSGFIESLNSRILDDPSFQDILIAPQVVYPVGGEPFVLPLLPNSEAERRLRETVAPAAAAAGRMLVLSRSDGPRYRATIKKYLEASGLVLSQERRFGAVTGLIYERR